MVTLCSYDISDNRIRQKVSNTLQHFGVMRVQKSVYAGEISGMAYKSLLKALDQIRPFLKKEDMIAVWKLSIDVFRAAIQLGDPIDYTLYLKCRGETLML